MSKQAKDPEPEGDLRELKETGRKGGEARSAEPQPPTKRVGYPVRERVRRLFEEGHEGEGYRSSPATA